MKSNTSHFYSIHYSSTQRLWNFTTAHAPSTVVGIIMQWPQEHLWEKLTCLTLVKNPQHFPHCHYMCCCQWAHRERMNPSSDESSLQELSLLLLDDTSFVLLLKSISLLQCIQYPRARSPHIYVITWHRLQQEMFRQEAFLAE